MARFAPEHYKITFHMPKYVSWQHDFYNTIGYIREAGIIEKFYFGPIPLEAREGWRPTRNSLSALSFDHIYFPLLCQIGGWGVSGLIFLAEQRVKFKRNF